MHKASAQCTFLIIVNFSSLFFYAHFFSILSLLASLTALSFPPSPSLLLPILFVVIVGSFLVLAHCSV